ncbi:hypothetical protein KEU06_19855 [Pseudaminobacter sp. 19-2017]|uniref:Uncharacterized protein n=1 Tax=Pseudaminobacter soli (ex Zhang et al. 2022) TaxID=2831468 RepID=A0A942IA11_9HYPH|nr:hypothetical protein [Pseudaminobacter soli]MBS3650870.1 hypothetical protein [Pseudaminobacter soli]
MFSRFSRGRQGPHILLIRDSDGPVRLDEARFIGWAKALGQVREAGPRSIRPHRGQLPDLDLSCAEPVKRRPGLFARIANAVLAGKVPDPDGDLSGDGKAALGKRPP